MDTNESMDRIIVSIGDSIVALTVPEIGDDSDVWEAIERYDEDHGTDLWDRLTEKDVLGVNLAEYADAPELGDVETIESKRPKEVIADIRITSTGHSLILKVTEQARILGVDRGDIVEVTIKRK